MSNGFSLEAPPKDLSAWLTYIEQLHPSAIEMGLGRIKTVADRLALKPTFKIITVAGTNGKGSTCTMLSQIYQHAGYRVGCYTSPHILRYNERVQVNGQEASDASLCAAFAAVEAARLGTANQSFAISLTYFEIGTLAAVWHFVQTGVDVAVLEIGLGGRLDAVNAFEPDCTIVTNVDLDHQDLLGDTRELIGYEKAGVYRASIPAICGDINPPSTLIAYAKEVKADLKCVQHEFGYELADAGWYYLNNQQRVYHLPIPALKGQYQLTNAACAITAVTALQSVLPVALESIVKAMQEIKLMGRFYTDERFPWLIFDVAHNPHAAVALAENLKSLKSLTSNKSGEPVRILSVFSMLADKDIKGVVEILKGEVDTWYVAPIEHARGTSVKALVTAIHEVIPDASVKTFASLADAYTQAYLDRESCIEQHENDKIVAFGSFFTVSSVMQYLNEHVNTPLRKQ
ncbi:bifunctional tetrahydrofolate synthase/dihydrofolate synthase [Methylotenera mobilis]|uniref:Dihydrofolate synthase/folylpolyglutamate synthase n=1 Tax=Methylotenera mobilis (strain JLW8 / ATCC BAA-1282 / DSM 17540) TaxID=583345 RepID=C6WVE3_METML|nr:bifunctional tetrahydrofolate synthase/dihydrofolate synthase [Methylotenera mobilis]ACT47892.1 FolC bifunctional protein [Methylotenera mobilis JLW8]